MLLRRPVIAFLVVAALIASTLAVWFTASPSPSGGNVKPRIDSAGTYLTGSQPDHEDEEAVAAAAHALDLALSYDYRHLSSDLDASTHLMTPSFSASFRTTFVATAAKLAPAQHAVTRAMVRGAAMVDRNGNTARCLMFVDQLRLGADTSTGAPQLSPSRVVVEMRREHGRWLLNGIDAG